MKKKLTALLLTGLMSFSLCSCELSTVKGYLGLQETKNEQSDVVVLNDFEEFEKDVQIIRLLNGFGQVNHNEDKAFVKSGEKSIQLRPKGFNYCTVPPFIVMPTYSQRFGFGYGDFTKVDSLSMWFYNAEETPVEVGVGLTSAAINNGQWYNTVSRVAAAYYSLNPGWNRIEYEVLPEWLGLQTTFKLNEVHGIYIECPYSESPRIDDTVTLYVDDVRLHYTDETRTTDINKIELKADTVNGVWEIADFESSTENTFFTMKRTGSANPMSCVPTAKVVNSSKHNVTTTSGDNVLEITLRAGSGQYGWPFLYGSEALMKYAFSKVGQDLIDNPQNYEIVFELYNAQDFKMGLTLYLKDSEGKDAISYGTSVKADAKSWTTFRRNLGELTEASTNNDYAANPGEFVFASAQYASAEDTSDRYVLIDNIRIEKIA